MTSAEIESSISHVPFNDKIVLPPRSREVEGASLSVAVGIAKSGKYLLEIPVPTRRRNFRRSMSHLFLILFDLIPTASRYPRPALRPTACLMCAVKGAGQQWVRVPPGNWIAPPGSNRSGGSGDEAVGAAPVAGPPVCALRCANVSHPSSMPCARSSKASFLSRAK